MQDNGTEGSIDDASDHAFWSGYGIMNSDYGMPAICAAKTLYDLLDMHIVPGDPEHTTEEIDAVSGATVWANAVRYAAIAALRSAPVSKSESTVLAPTLTEQTCVPNASYKYIDVAMNADDDTTIRYTSTVLTRLPTAPKRLPSAGLVISVSACPPTQQTIRAARSSKSAPPPLPRTALTRMWFGSSMYSPIR